MHLPAMAAIKCTEHYKAIFSSIVSKPGKKRKAAVAVQRKLLEMDYTIHNTKQPYEIEYMEKQAKKKLELKLKKKPEVVEA